MSTDSAAAEPFDLFAAARAVGQPPRVDCEGAGHFAWGRAGLSVKPAGQAAICDVTIAVSDGRLLHRRLALTTEGATLLAQCLQRLRLVEMGDAAAVAWEVLASDFPFGDPDELSRGRGLVVAAGVDLAEAGADNNPELPWRVDDLLHLMVLRRQFPLARVSEWIADDHVPRACIRQGDSAIWLSFTRDSDAPGSGAGRVMGFFTRSDEPAPMRLPDFDLDPPGVLLLLTVGEALQWVSTAEREGDLDQEAFGGLHSRLLALRDEVIEGVNALTGFRRLAALFELDSSPELPDVAPAQLHALAMMAVRKWSIRRGRRSAGPPLDLERVVAAAGREPVLVGDTYVLRFARAMFSFRVDSDVAFGWFRLVDWSGFHHAGPFACSAKTLERRAWAGAVHDAAEGLVRGSLAMYLMGGSSSPWFDEDASVARLVTELQESAGSMQGEARERLLQILGGVP